MASALLVSMEVVWGVWPSPMGEATAIEDVSLEHFLILKECSDYRSHSLHRSVREQGLYPLCTHLGLGIVWPKDCRLLVYKDTTFLPTAKSYCCLHEAACLP